MKKVVSYIALFLVVVGALNWGLWGFFQFDFVAWLCGGNTMWMSRVIYSVIGLAGLWCLKFLCCCRSSCCSGSCGCSCKCCSGSGKSEGKGNGSSGKGSSCCR